MNGRSLIAKIDWQTRYRAARQKVQQNISRHWYKFFLLILAGFLLHHKDLSIDLQLSGLAIPQLGASLFSGLESEDSGSPAPGPRPRNTSLVADTKATQPARQTKEDNLANSFSNLSFDSENTAASGEERARAEKRRKQISYIDRFGEIACAEMKQYGIPASITLAQGLLESNVGESRLARKNNNHFGIKCFSKSCKKGHCSNFTDDHHKDFFRVYAGAWESYRAHSLLLKNSRRYHRLFKLDPNDYRGWAHGLKNAGYATDKRYAEKLIHLIEDLDLHTYDCR